jgi:hypothetical protein
MAMWKLIVWSRFRGADRDDVAATVIDAHEMSQLMPRWLRLHVSNPIGLAQARREGEAERFAARLRTPFGLLDAPIEVLEGSGPLRFTERCTVLGFRTWLHRHRVERAIGGRTRYVDELILQPDNPGGSLFVRAVEQGLKRTHRNLVQHLVTDAADREAARISSRVYRLEEGNRAHAEAALGEIPGV